MPVWGDGQVPERVRGRKQFLDGKVHIPDTGCDGAHDNRRYGGFHKKYR